MGFWMGEWDLNGILRDLDGILMAFYGRFGIVYGIWLGFEWDDFNGILMGSGFLGTGIDVTAIQVGNWAIWAIWAIWAMDWGTSDIQGSTAASF